MSRMALKQESLPGKVTRVFEEIEDMVNICMQCGTCTASCVNNFAMDLTPRHIIRLVQLGFYQDILESDTFWMCSSCYYCTLRCPRGVPVTKVMATLKRVAGMINEPAGDKKSAFYKTFIGELQS